MDKIEACGIEVSANRVGGGFKREGREKRCCVDSRTRLCGHQAVAAGSHPRGEAGESLHGSDRSVWAGCGAAVKRARMESS